MSNWKLLPLLASTVFLVGCPSVNTQEIVDNPVQAKRGWIVSCTPYDGIKEDVEARAIQGVYDYVNDRKGNVDIMTTPRVFCSEGKKFGDNFYCSEVCAESLATERESE